MKQYQCTFPCKTSGKDYSLGIYTINTPRYLTMRMCDVYKINQCFLRWMPILKPA